MLNLSSFRSGGSKIKSIQRGIITLSGNKNLANTTITAVNTNKSELRYLGIYMNDATTVSRDVMIYLTSSTNIRAERDEVTYTTSASWELTEWE